MLEPCAQRVAKVETPCCLLTVHFAQAISWKAVRGGLGGVGGWGEGGCERGGVRGVRGGALHWVGGGWGEWAGVGGGGWPGLFTNLTPIYILFTNYLQTYSQTYLQTPI